MMQKNKKRPNTQSRRDCELEALLCKMELAMQDLRHGIVRVRRLADECCRGTVQTVGSRADMSVQGANPDKSKGV
jgi:hypothetical protein